uniref:Protein Wnt n=1 Tax=Ciona intestinalis TaxID=7719 RepID=Q4H305_CIOIN|nr:Wnt signaling ligand [Ciona intestinalis]BAE06622.1 Wnt signaling ligand [Ciona intestinalis]|eukprot:NP_001071795.1 Wnt signaling ligand [Ciona intestinalis]
MTLQRSCFVDLSEKRDMSDVGGATYDEEALSVSEMLSSHMDVSRATELSQSMASERLSPTESPITACCSADQTGIFSCTFCRKPLRAANTIRRSKLRSRNLDDCGTTPHESTAVTSTDRSDNELEMRLGQNRSRNSEHSEAVMQNDSDIPNLSSENLCRKHRRNSVERGVTKQSTWRVHRRILPAIHSSVTIVLLQVLLFCTVNVAAVWWNPGYRPTLMDSERICLWAQQIGGPQAEMCANEMPVVEEIKKGIQRGAYNCAREFRYSRWNCSQTPKKFYEKALWQTTKETSYLQAVTSAAMTFAITEACSLGNIPECGCVNTRGQKREYLRREAQKRNYYINESYLDTFVDQFDWEGCDDNVDFAYRKTRHFLNFTRFIGRKRKINLRLRMSAHNYEAGRLAITEKMAEKCKCHGFSGTCTIRTCWMRMPKFDAVRATLRRMYNTATKVNLQPGTRRLVIARRPRRPSSRHRNTASRRTNKVKRGLRKNIPTRFRSRNRKAKNPRRRIRLKNRLRRRLYPVASKHLVYHQPSPNFCRRDKRKGSLGTKGRVCDPTRREGYGSCQYMCCGRGYTTEVVEHTMKCNCTFIYCCTMTCDECINRYTRYVCR